MNFKNLFYFLLKNGSFCWKAYCRKQIPILLRNELTAPLTFVGLRPTTSKQVTWLFTSTERREKQVVAGRQWELVRSRLDLGSVKWLLTQHASSAAACGQRHAPLLKGTGGPIVVAWHLSFALKVPNIIDPRNTFAHRSSAAFGPDIPMRMQ